MIHRVNSLFLLRCLFVALISLGFGVTTGCNSRKNDNAQQTTGQATHTELRKDEKGHWQLLRNDKPYYVNGAAGPGPLKLLAECGANSNRTWGVGEETIQFLNDAHANQLSVSIGIWLERESPQFNYNDQNQLEEQENKVMEAVKKFKNHPAVLLWGLGNEMEGYSAGDNPNVWKHIEHLAQLVKKEDPHHPVMTVIAEIGGQRIQSIHKYCPSVDIIGINSYGGAISIPQRYRQAGGTKPYIVTEFGPRGPWEVSKNAVDSIDESTSTDKAETYRATYQKLKSDVQLCIGSYAFLWGDKQEATPTWFGMLLPDGEKTAAVDTMSELWSGSKPKNLCPRISSLELEGSNQVGYGETIRAKLDASDPEGKPLTVKWVLMADAKNYITAGEFQKTPPSYANAIVSSSETGAEVRMPNKRGLYRLYAYVSDGAGGGACGNISLRVKDPKLDQPGKKVDIPYTMFGEKSGETFFVPSGFMGSVDALSVDQEWTKNPKSGQHCIKCQYTKSADWGGVVWQHPENDWGDQPGGLDLTGAKKLTFWARGEKGKEKVKFGVGLLGEDKAYFDTTKHELPFTLKKDWTQYTIDLANSDLRRIKSGFFFSLAAQGDSVTFYLDEIVFE